MALEDRAADSPGEKRHPCRFDFSDESREGSMSLLKQIGNNINSEVTCPTSQPRGEVPGTFPLYLSRSWCNPETSWFTSGLVLSGHKRRAHKYMFFRTVFRI